MATGLVSTSLSAGSLEGPPHPNEAVRLDVDGAEGVWLPLAMAKRIQADAESVPLLRSKVDKLETKLEIRGERIENCKEALALSQDSELKLREAQDIQTEISSELEDRLDSPARNPFLWLGVGAGATLVVEVLVIILINSASK